MGRVTMLLVISRNAKCAQVEIPSWTIDVSRCPCVKSGLKDEVHRSELILSALEKSWKIRVSPLQWLEREIIEGARIVALVENCEFNERR